MSLVSDIKDILPDYEEVTDDDIINNSYKPLEWAKAFHMSPAKIKFLCGAFGSGKSRSVSEELYQLALEYPGSEILVARWEMPDLRQTAMKSMLSVIPTKMIKSFNKTNRELYLHNDTKFLFKSLKDDIENPEKIKSYEFTMVWLEEVSELERPMFTAVMQRLRGKAKKGMPYRNVLIASFNPTGEDHWLYDVCVKNPMKDSQVFKSRTWDNLENLPPGYIDTLKSVYPREQWPQVFEGEFGSLKTEMGVFSSDFKKSYHCREIEYDRTVPLRRSWDWGFNHPSAIVFQVMPNGQHRTLKEFFGTNIFLDQFAQQVVSWCEREYDGAKFLDYGDPHGADKKDTGVSSFQLMKEMFQITIISRRTTIMEGIMLMRKKLNTLVNGEPSWILDIQRCPTLIAGLGGGYKIDKDTNMPKKDGYFEHCFDAIRYGFVNTEFLGKATSTPTKRYYNPNVSLNSYKGR